MRFSILTPTYNRANIIGETIQSIQNQTLTDWEMIIIDDGSTDSSVERLQHFREQDQRIRVIPLRENNGACVARNIGLDHAYGDIIVYVDSDDVLLPNYLQALATLLEAHPEKQYGTSNHTRHIVLLNEQGELIAQKEPFVMCDAAPTIQDYYHWNVKPCGTGLWHRLSFVIEHSLRWDEDQKRFQDWEFLLQMGRADPNGFLHVFEPLVYYKQMYGVEGMCARAQYKDWAEAFEQVYQKLKNDPLMVGQQWYPERIERYTRLQQLVDKGKEPPAMYKYFPEYIQKNGS